MASDEFRHAAKQETLYASLPMRTNDDQIGTPLCCGIDDSLSDVTNLDSGVDLEPGTTQLVRNSLDQLTGWFLLIVQFRSVACAICGGAGALGCNTCKTRTSVFSVRNCLTIALNTSSENFEPSIPIRIFMTPTQPHEAIRYPFKD